MSRLKEVSVITEVSEGDYLIEVITPTKTTFYLINKNRAEHYVTFRFKEVICEKLTTEPRFEVTLIKYIDALKRSILKKVTVVT